MTKKVGKGTQPTSAIGERGFTLIELLVVMTLLVLMVGLFPLALNHALPSRRVETAAEIVWGALRYAQSLSAVTGQSVQVRVDESQIEVESRRNWRLPASASLLAGSSRRSRERLTFFPDGSSDGGAIEVSLSSQSRVIRVSALTGRITVGRP